MGKGTGWNLGWHIPIPPGLAVCLATSPTNTNGERWTIPSSYPFTLLKAASSTALPYLLSNSIYQRSFKGLPSTSCHLPLSDPSRILLSGLHGHIHLHHFWPILYLFLLFLLQGLGLSLVGPLSFPPSSDRPFFSTVDEIFYQPDL